MDLKKLRKVLIRLGVHSHRYNLNEKSGIEEKMCIKKTDQGWEVFFSERGHKFDLMVFDTEEEACNALLKEFLDEI